MPSPPEHPLVLFGVAADRVATVEHALREAGLAADHVRLLDPTSVDAEEIDLQAVVQELVEGLDVQRHLAETARALRTLEAAMNQARDGMVVTDAELSGEGPTILWANPAFADLVQASPDDLRGERLFSLEPLRPTRRRILNGLRKRGSWEGPVLYGPVDDVHHLEGGFGSVTDGSVEATRFVGVFRDITEKKRVEDRLQHLAHHDHLTGLPNRKLLLDRLTLALARARRYSAPLAVLFIDLDGFKGINDTLGHAAGDAVLVKVSERLSALVRASDTVARLGGDEFVVILPEVRAIANAERVASKIVDTVSEVIRAGDHELFVTPSIGLAAWPDHGDDVHVLLARADQAMYAAKAAGKGRAIRWEPSLDEGRGDHDSWVLELREAFEAGRLHLDAQPFVDTTSGPVAAEVLLRWTHPERGPVSPATFLPMVAEAGLSAQVLPYMIARGAPIVRDTDIALAVGARPEWISDEGAVDALVEALAAASLPPERLWLQITESALMSLSPGTRHALGRLRSLGVRVVVDHYGTSHLSVPLMRTLPIDAIKLHDSLTEDAGEDDALIQGLLTLCGSLGLELLADGVSSFTQRDALEALGIRVQAGPMHGRPGPAAELPWTSRRSAS